MSSALANHLWWACSLPRLRRFEAALADPGATQERWLRDTLRRQRDTEFGRRFGFRDITSVRQFQERVPLSNYDDHAGDIARIRAGQSNVLTSEPVTRLIPSSGSTAACKLIPYTRTLQAEFNRAIGPWIADLFRRQPGLARGPAYWSISPAVEIPGDGSSAVPVGFDDDSRYLGLMQRFVRAALAVPADVRHVADADSFRYVTLLFLLRARGLRLMSVWHPTFLTLLLSRLREWWPALLRDLAEGRVRPPTLLGPEFQARIDRLLPPFRARARELDHMGPASPRDIWPRLGQISCWCDGPAAAAAATLRDGWPGVAVAPKGLLATEAFVTLPFAGGWPVAVRSHFFEFLDDADRPRLVEELKDGCEYRVVVTTGGGLYRYRLADRVRVAGLVGRTPSLRFVGKEDRISDQCGEKLSDGFVAGVLESALAPRAGAVVFAMLAPDDHHQGTPGYTLFAQFRAGMSAHDRASLLERVERGLLANPHYAWCRRLGQLAPPRLYEITGDAHAAFTARCIASGRRLGDVKPVSLSPELGWPTVFPGGFTSEIGVPSMAGSP